VQARAAEVRSDGVMFKPFGVEDLVRRVDGLLAERSNGAKQPVAKVPAVTAAAPVSTAAPAFTAATTSDRSLKEQLQGLAGTPGVRFVVLADREGFVIETAGELAPDAGEVAGALASCLAEASEGIGRELGQGQLLGTIFEYEAGMLLLHGVGPSALLAVLVGDQGALGKARYYMRKTVPELLRVL